MMTVVVRERTVWNDYFTGTPTSLQTTEYTSRQTPSGTNVLVSNCLFKFITTTSQGGALYCYNSVTNFLVESTSFFSCKTSRNEGAIYFLNTDGQCVLYKVCGYDCCTTSGYSYQFAYMQVKKTALSMNYVNYSSVSSCVNEYSGACYTLTLERGKICCTSVNLSLNKCYSQSGIACYPTVDTNSVTCSLTYSSFTDNHATGYNCIYLDTGGANYEIKSCNVIRNIQGSLNAYGTIYTTGNLIIEDSCILENTATNIFYQYSSSYTITISNCTVDKTTCNQNLVTQNTVTKSFILALNHMSTRNCHSEYDSAGTLTPVIQSPSPLISQKHCYTFGNNLSQFQLRYLVSLISVSIFSFIHSGSSGDCLY
jgi:hypothetical protein